MATNRNPKLKVSKRTLFRFSGKETARRGVSTDPTTLTVTLTSDVMWAPANKK